MIWLWVLLIVYVLGFIICARAFDYGPRGTGTDKLIGALIWPLVFINLFWRIWTKQITATFTVKRRSGKVYTKKIGKKEDHA